MAGARGRPATEVIEPPDRDLACLLPGEHPRVPSEHRPFLAAVNEELRRFLIHKREETEATAPECLVLVDEISRVIDAGGKRLRPLLCYLGYRAAGGAAGEEIVRAAAAMELVHTFAIVHDDLIDDARLRRGVPSSSERLAGEHGSRFGRSSALLVGDLCHILADELLCLSGFPPAWILDAFHHFNRMRRDTVCGEYLDVTFSVEGCRDEAAIRRMAELKTASYSIVGPLLVGAALGGADDETCVRLAEYGRLLGLGFQFSDDVIGLFGDVSFTGKDGDTDPRKGCQTVLLARAWETGGPATRRLLQRLAAKPEIPAADLRRLRLALEECGALDRTLASIQSLTAEAKRALQPLPMDADLKQALFAVAEWVATRGDRCIRVQKKAPKDADASAVLGGSPPLF